MGDVKEKQSKVKFNTTMSPEVWKRIRIRAIEEDLTASELLEKIALEYLDRVAQKPAP